MFAEAIRRRDLVIDKEELPFLLFRFHPSLHSPDSERQNMGCASKGVFCFRPLSWCLGLAVFRQRLFEVMELCCDVGAAVPERETVQITRSFLSDRLLDEPVYFGDVHRREGNLLIAGDVNLSHDGYPHFSRWRLTIGSAGGSSVMGGAKRYPSIVVCEWVMGFANRSTHPTYYNQSPSRDLHRAVW
jgi:hypothetical protein